MNTASFDEFVNGSGGSGTSAPNADEWHEAADSFWQISFSTAGYQDLTLSSKQRGSNTGPRDFKVQWSLNGSVWTDVPSASITVATNFTTGKLVDVSLPTGTKNQNTVYLRWIKASNINVNGGTVASGGTSRIDDIIVRGEPLSYAVTYDGNTNTGGSAPTDTNTYHISDTITVQGNTGILVKTGYTFAGWNTSANGSGTAYAAAQTFAMGSSNVTLYAQWRYVLAQGPVVFYHIYGGGGNVNGVYRNDAVVLKNTGSITVNLDGWNIKYTSFNGTNWNLRGPLSGSICPGAYYVIKAFPGANTKQAEIPYFHVSLPELAIDQREFRMQLLDGNSTVVDFIGSGAAIEYLGNGAASFTSSSSQSLIRNTAASNPYSGNNNLDYIVQSPTNLSYLMSDQIYSVTFDKNTGDSAAQPSSMSILHGQIPDSLPTEPLKANHRFAGWNTAADGSGSKFDLSYSVTTCLRVYAQWTLEDFRVTFLPGLYGSFDPLGASASQTIAYGSDATAPTVLPNEGYDFIGWDSSFTNVTGIRTITAQYKNKNFIVSFDTQGGSPVSAVNADYGETITAPADPIRTGYLFGGWYKEDALKTAWNFSQDTVSGNMILYARWTLEGFLVTFQPGLYGSFDSSGASASQTIAYGADATAPTVLPNGGYDFIGWDSSFTNVTGDLTITAQYAIKNFTVSFDTQGGSPVSAVNADYSETITAPADPIRTGYLFGGWYKEDALKTAWNFSQDTVTRNMTLYARWIAKPVSDLPDNLTMFVGANLSLSPQPSGGTWTWDIYYFTFSPGETATFKALKKGDTVLKYTVNGVSHSINVTVLPLSTPLPDTGEHGISRLEVGMLLLFLGCALVIIFKQSLHKAKSKKPL